MANSIIFIAEFDYKIKIGGLVQTTTKILGGGATVGQHAVVFALNANNNRAPVLQALCIVSQAWSTMKKQFGIITKFHIVWM